MARYDWGSSGLEQDQENLRKDQEKLRWNAASPRAFHPVPARTQHMETNVHGSTEDGIAQLAADKAFYRGKARMLSFWHVFSAILCLILAMTLDMTVMRWVYGIATAGALALAVLEFRAINLRKEKPR